MSAYGRNTAIQNAGLGLTPQRMAIMERGTIDDMLAADAIASHGSYHLTENMGGGTTTNRTMQQLHNKWATSLSMRTPAEGEEASVNRREQERGWLHRQMSDLGGSNAVDVNPTSGVTFDWASTPDGLKRSILNGVLSRADTATTGTNSTKTYDRLVDLEGRKVQDDV